MDLEKCSFYGNYDNNKMNQTVGGQLYIVRKENSNYKKMKQFFLKKRKEKKNEVVRTQKLQPQLKC